MKHTAQRLTFIDMIWTNAETSSDLTDTKKTLSAWRWRDSDGGTGDTDTTGTDVNSCRIEEKQPGNESDSSEDAQNSSGVEADTEKVHADTIKEEKKQVKDHTLKLLIIPIVLFINL